MKRATAEISGVDELAMPWIVAEDEIRAMMENEGMQEDTDFLSGGMSNRRYKIRHFS